MEIKFDCRPVLSAVFTPFGVDIFNPLRFLPAILLGLLVTLASHGMIVGDWLEAIVAAFAYLCSSSLDRISQKNI